MISMKKFMRIFSVVMILLFAVNATFILGCKNDKEQEQGKVLLSFESEKELQSMTLYREINKVEVNREKDYITDGEGSLRICPNLEPLDGVYPSSYIAFLGGGKYFTKTNLNDVNCLSVDVYNPSTSDYFLVWGVRGNDSTSYIIKSGWNKLYKYVDREMLYANNEGYVEMISFFFEGREESLGNLDVYLDNIRYYETAETFEKLSVSAKEIIRFENKVEKNVFEVQKKSGDVTAECVLSINQDLRFIKSGTGSLKITAGSSAAEVVDKPVLKALGSNLPDFNNYRNDGWYFTMPVFNGSKNIVSCSLQFSSPLESYYYAFEIAPMSWAKESEKISVDHIKAQFAGDGIDVQSITVKFEGLKAGDSVYIDCIGVTK